MSAEVLQARADVAGLMLASVDAPEMVEAFAQTLDPEAASRLLACAIGGIAPALIRASETAAEAGEPATVRQLLELILSTCREEIDRLQF